MNLSVSLLPARYGRTKEEQYLVQAKALAQDIHETLGRKRNSFERLPGASEERPTAGGLRIGKEEEEGRHMEGDGVYFHYITKMCLALERLVRLHSTSIGSVMVNLLFVRGGRGMLGMGKFAGEGNGRERVAPERCRFGKGVSQGFCSHDQRRCEKDGVEDGLPSEQRTGSAGGAS